MSKRHLALSTVITISMLVFAFSVSNAGNYEIINLGLPSADFLAAKTGPGINSKGQVIGALQPQFGNGSLASSYVITPDNGVWFLDDNADGFNDLMVVLAPPTGFRDLIASAINDHGQIVGRIKWDTAFSFSRAFLWDNGAFTILGPEDSSSVATGINNDGQISGFSAGKPVIWKNGQKTVLGGLPGSVGSAMTNGINNRGEVVGWQRDVANNFSKTRALLWRNSSPIDLGTLGGEDVFANAINDSGQVVGRSEIILGSGERHAFLWENGIMKDIGAMERPGRGLGNANDINNKGQVIASLGLGTGFLWLPTPAYGLSAGAHFAPRLPSSSGWAIHSLDEINDDGLIVGWGQFEGVFQNYLMIPPPPEGLIVNTVGDAPDSDLTDGECNTGNVAANGQPECTMRAAIEEANAQAGLDTILFNIPASGIPVIQVGSSLPEITDSVVIDGSTQPTSGKVEINGSAALSADGLTISSGNSEIRHLLINNFAGDGLVLLTGDSNTIGNLSIGVGTDGVADRGNDGYGILVLNSSNNKIGDAILNRKNIIAHNGQSGVFVESGTGNTIRGNSIFSNSGLGIDLALKGVTDNDIGDGDSGANSLQNFPVIDSVKVGLVSTVWGTLTSTSGQSYDIDIYLNDSCDTLGYGEGKKLIQSAPVFVDAAGTAEFAIQAVVTPALGQFISATTTDRDGNTSEFSASISAINYLRIVDAQNSTINNKKFALFKVANDVPMFTEVFVDSVTTDGEGLVDLSQYDIAPKDTLRFSRQLNAVLSPKRTTVPASAYSVNIDNAQFDSASSQMSYFEMPNGNDCDRDVEVAHTTVAFNLYVSIEFDATVAYVNNLREAFRRASNYLYDVTDGQARFDTVVISDNRAGWNIADVWVHASNMEWPRATLNGLLKSGASDRFYMPRKFYGTSTANRNMSAQENPLNTATPNNYRTFIHELGHYALKFGDEYLFINVAGHCSAVGLYGFMESQYASRVVARSEMSQASMYSQGRCQNTNQYDDNRNSCWETFESTFQNSYDGVFAPIIMPDERMLPVGQTFLLGPNDNLASLDVNIGAKIVFLGALSSPGIPPRRYRFIASDGVTSAGNVAVSQFITSSGREVKQGKTADNGLLYFMGASSAYTYSAAGVSNAISASPGARPRRVTDFSWSFGDGAVPTSDTGSIVLSEVQGELPLIPSVILTASGIQYSLRPLNQFIATPSQVTKVDNQLIDSSELVLVGRVYRATIPDTSSTRFEITVHATDNASHAYFFSSEILIDNLSGSGLTGRTAGSQTDFSLRLDTTVAATRQIILATDYPPIRSGLTPAQIQAGKVGVVQAFPLVSALSGINTLQIRYQEGSVESNGIDSELEQTLRIHHWDEALGEWTLVGGSVDTSQNEVSAEINELGTYALFTTDIQTGIGDDDSDGETGSLLPKRFEAHQNFPNPFNPTTVISYSLPVKANVTISIYNVLGQRVKLFEQGEQSADEYSVTWDATDTHGKSVASGMYFYKITAGDFSASRKMVLLK